LNDKGFTLLDLIVFVGLAVVWIILIIGVTKIHNYTQKNGIKPIIMAIWEGDPNYQSPSHRLIIHNLKRIKESDNQPINHDQQPDTVSGDAVK